MKRLSPVGIAAALAIIVTPLATMRAQSSRAIHVGVIAGVAQSNLKGEDASEDLKPVSRPLAGISLVFAGASKAQLEIDGLYVAKGFRSEGNASSFELNAKYLEIPLLLRLSAMREKSARPFIAIGPAFGVRIGCSFESTAGAVSTSRSCDDAALGAGFEIAKSDLSGTIGAGVDINAGKGQLTLATRYTRGFSKALGDANNYNRSLAVFAGFSISKTR